jgi:hypothetical protein
MSTSRKAKKREKRQAGHEADVLTWTDTWTERPGFVRCVCHGRWLTFHPWRGLIRHG